MMKIFALAERVEDLKDLCDRAGSIGDVEAILVNASESEAAEVTTAAKVWLVPEQQFYEDSVSCIQALVAEEKPDMLLVQPTVRLKLVAGKLAARMGTSVIPNVSEFGDGEFKCMTYGGAGVVTRKVNVPCVIAFDAPGVLEASGAEHVPVVVTIDAGEPDSRIVVKERRAKEAASVDLAKSKCVIGIGRGIQKYEDLGMVNELAAAINAEIGCTRPISEGEKWLPREAYIGVSGVVVAPDVYVALGIAGQVQHTIGVTGSKTIIAVNKNGDAPIFDVADYGIVADLYKVVPKLIEALK